MDCEQDTEEGVVNETALAVQGTQMGNRQKYFSPEKWARRGKQGCSVGTEGGH